MTALARAWVLLVALVSGPALAKGPVLVTLATWQKANKEPVLVVKLTEQLSKRQKDLINSGFSTHSELEVRAEGPDEETLQVLFNSQCTIKFDTWEEIYDIARIDKDFQTLTAKTFETYADICLTARVPGAAVIAATAAGSKAVRATLKVNQITTEKAAKIREWLIKQQSGVMQGLFSHMLGDLKLFEEINVTVQVPPLTADVERGKSIVVSPDRRPVER